MTKETNERTTKNLKQKPDKRIIKLKGEVVEVLPGSEYKVKIELAEGNEKIITAYNAGKMRNNKIKVLAGDIVDVELDKDTITDGKGRVTYRYIKK